MTSRHVFQTLVFVVCTALTSIGAEWAAAEQDNSESEIVITQGLVLLPVGEGGRRPVHRDALEAMIVRGEFSAPAEGETIETAEGETQTWQAINADENGTFSHRALRGGYFYASAESDRDRVMLLEASGHSTVYVNGMPRAGDPYQTNWLRTPVRIHTGRNDLLFQCSRGSVSAKLVAPTSEIMFSDRDWTLPDLLAGQRNDAYGSAMIINTTDHALTNLELAATITDDRMTVTSVPVIGPMTLRRVPFRVRGRVIAEPGAAELQLVIRRAGDVDEVIDTTAINLDVRDPGGHHKRTFISDIDGSVQYFAVVPPAQSTATDAEEKPGLMLTLHGAGVQATGQANAYSAKDCLYIVAPTNRRPFGFDWEDWGRSDAIEVLDLALREFDTDQARTYLTGHSMGGHGTWQVGVTFPDRFAAISPSAAWISFWSYAGAARYENGTPIEQILTRATSASDTLALSRNYLQYGVFITHGDRDDNVPVEQARTMREHLAKYHPDFAYYERPGAGHWWGVDFAPMFDFFKHHTIPATRNDIEFYTASPGVSASCRWVTIETQQHAYVPSSVDLHFVPATRTFSGTTDNVERLSIGLDEVAPGDPVSFDIDGSKIEHPMILAGTKRIWLSREEEDGPWQVIDRPSADSKSPHRSGAFKDAFRNRMMFVYGTQGNSEENAWAYTKARFDAETFGYRGNGSIDVIADVDFDPEAEPDRNVILYGNAETNGAWDALLETSPVQVMRDHVSLGDRRIDGDELACLVIRPRPGSDVASVGAVSGTGVVGMRVTDRLPYFVSGIAYPDCIVIDAAVLTQGPSAIRAAGFFGTDWTIESGDFAYQK